MKVIIKIIIVASILTLESCVQDTHLKTVTFKVDMNRVENPFKVGLRGEFTNNPWNETIFLTDDNKDGIYEGTFSQKTAQNKVEFKFVNQNDQFELKEGNNRMITFKYKPETVIYEAIFNNKNGKQTVKID